MDREADDADEFEQSRDLGPAAGGPPAVDLPIDAPEPDVLEQSMAAGDPELVEHEWRTPLDAAEADALEQRAPVPLDDDDDRR